MFYSVLVPSSSRADFALFLDSFLSRIEDHNLVFFFENSKVENRKISLQDWYIASQIISLINHAQLCASKGNALFVRQALRFGLEEVGYLTHDLWSFALNPNRLISDIIELDQFLHGLGCYGAVHSAIPGLKTTVALPSELKG